MKKLNSITIVVIKKKNESDKKSLRKVLILLLIAYMMIANTSPLFADMTYENSLVAYWDFDEGSGTALGDATGVNDGILVNDPAWTTGIFDGALDFDGGDDLISIPYTNSFDFQDELSVGAWIKYDQLINLYPRIISQVYSGSSGVFNMLVSASTSKVRWAIGDYFLDSTMSLTPNQWYHIMGIFNGPTDTQKLYINGIESGYMSNPSTIPNSNNNLFIAHYPGYTRYWKGQIDDISIWNRALNSDEVSSIYNVGVQGFEGILDGINNTFGALGYTTDEINQLTQLYADGKANLPVENLDFGDNITWTYEDGILPEDIGYEIGDSWITTDGKYCVKLGSGLIGDPISGVPEVPASSALVLLSSLFIIRRKKKI